MHKTHNGSCFQPIQLKTHNQLSFVWGKEIQAIFGDFSCVNHFENHGNKPLELLMEPFESTIWFKTWKLNMIIV